MSKKSKNSKLLEQVIELSGLSSQIIKNELCHILDKKNIDLDKMTVEQLRVVVASYFREIMGKLIDQPDSTKTTKDPIN